MANNTLIQIKRSGSAPNPSTLGPGELAISSVSNVLFIGLPDGSNTVVGIGGVRYPGTLTANQALVANATLGLDRVITANLSAQQIYANGSVGTAGWVLASGASDNVYWLNTASITVTPSGSNTQIQFNNSGAFGASAGLTFSQISNTLSVSNALSAKYITSTSNVTNITTDYNSVGGTVGIQGDLYIGTGGEAGIGNVYVNGAVSVGNSTVFTTINSTAFTGSANNAAYLGGNAAANFVQNTDSRTLSGNLVFSGANLNITGTNTYITSNVTFASVSNIDATSSTLSVRDIVATGNLTVSGTLTAIDTQTLQVKDNFIKLADQNWDVPADSVDFGFYGVANTGGSNTYFGIGRIAGMSNTFTVFSTTTEPGSSLSGTTIGTLQTYLSSGALVSNSSALVITANATVNVSITANTISLSSALPVGSGGTGIATLAAGALLYGNSTANMVPLSVGSNGQVLQVVSSLPAYGGLDGGTF